MEKPAPALRTGAVARLLRVSTDTVRRWADSGALPSFRVGEGQRRFLPEDVEEFAAQLEANRRAS